MALPVAHRLACCISINEMRMQTVVADGSSNAEMWATQLKAVQQQLVDAHKQNAEALAETREHWVQERRQFLVETQQQRFAGKHFIRSIREEPKQRARRGWQCLLPAYAHAHSVRLYELPKGGLLACLSGPCV